MEIRLCVVRVFERVGDSERDLRTLKMIQDVATVSCLTSRSSCKNFKLEATDHLRAQKLMEDQEDIDCKMIINSS
jgi:hypothetical protein